MRLIVFVLAMSALESIAFASSEVDLGSYFQEQIQKATFSVSDSDPGNSEPVDWQLTKMFLNVSPDATFGIPGAAMLTVTPEIEFVWERE